MSDQENLFTEEGEHQKPQDPVVEDRNYLEDLVGEGKKFKDAQALARGKAESDAYILKLQEELQGLRTDLSERLTAEQVAENLRKQLASSNTIPEQPASQQAQYSAQDGVDQNEGDNRNAPQSLTREEIDKLVNQRLQESQSQQTQRENLRSVKQALIDTLGPGYEAELRQSIDSLGLSQTEADTLARTQPKAFLKMVVGDRAPTKPSPASNQISRSAQGTNSDSFTSSQSSGLKNYCYYERMRKEDPAKYWTPQVQNEMFAQAKELGPEVFNS